MEKAKSNERFEWSKASKSKYWKCQKIYDRQ